MKMIKGLDYMRRARSGLWDSKEEKEDSDIQQQQRQKLLEGVKRDTNKEFEQNERLKASLNCKICLSETISIVFIPCSNFVSCASCALMVSKCPICRETTEGCIKPPVL